MYKCSVKLWSKAEDKGRTYDSARSYFFPFYLRFSTLTSGNELTAQLRYG